MKETNASFGSRALFPHLKPVAYLNHSAISPPSLPVQSAVHAVLADYAERGVDAFVSWMAQRDRLRADLSELINARPEDIGFVPNTTQGIINMAMCMPWRPGDRIVLFDGEFPTNITPWQRAAKEFDLELVFLSLAGFDDTGNGLARLKAELQRGVRLVAVSAVQFQTGQRLPLDDMGQLCREYGALFSVDAIQACGVVPVDVQASQIDFLACGSHKWLMGLEGCGFIYIRPERVRTLIPRLAGWLSHEDGLGFLFDGSGHLRYDRPIRKRADFVEVGAYNVTGFAALEASLSLIQQLGVSNIHAHVNAYLDVLEAGLIDRGFVSARADRRANQSGILSVLPPDGVALSSLVESLSVQHVSCSMPDGRLRFAPHWPNDVAEVPQVLAAIDAFIRSR